MSNGPTPQEELEFRSRLEEPLDYVESIRPLRWEEDGTICLGCQKPIHFRRAEERMSRKIVAVMTGGGLCCSQFCADVERGLRDNEEFGQEKAVDQWLHDQGELP